MQNKCPKTKILTSLQKSVFDSPLLLCKKQTKHNKIFFQYLKLESLLPSTLLFLSQPYLIHEKLFWLYLQNTFNLRPLQPSNHHLSAGNGISLLSGPPASDLPYSPLLRKFPSNPERKSQSSYKVPRYFSSSIL